MHADAMLKYGHLFFMNALEGVDERHIDVGGVCGDWSVKDIVAHLTSLEWLLVEILQWVLDNDAMTPQLAAYGRMGDAQFNTTEVDRRKSTRFPDVLEEYLAAQARTVELLAQVPAEMQRKIGLLAWYGADYDLEDFIVYTYYAHKREHGAQLNVFKDKLKAEGLF